MAFLVSVYVGILPDFLSHLVCEISDSEKMTSEQPTLEVPESAVLNIQKFAQNRQIAEKESVHEPLSATALHAYARRLDGTLLQLQDQVRRQEEELRRVCATYHPLY